MEQWKTLAQASNRAFASHQYYTALELCEKALDEALKCNANEEDSNRDSLLAAVLVSHFNLVDTHMAMHCIDKAVAEFQQALGFLQRQLRQAQGCDIRKAAVLRAGACLHREWHMFFKQNHTDLPKDICLSTAGLHLH